MRKKVLTNKEKKKLFNEYVDSAVRNRKRTRLDKDIFKFLENKKVPVLLKELMHHLKKKGYFESSIYRKIKSLQKKKAILFGVNPKDNKKYVKLHSWSDWYFKYFRGAKVYS